MLYNTNLKKISIWLKTAQQLEFFYDLLSSKQLLEALG